jgi:Na+-translocating ferredoxin:NAD+ oxidoreductase RnfG subunit
MKPFLSQIIATINVETWQAFGAIFVLVAGQIFRFFQEWIKDRRERESEAARLEVLKAMLGNLEHLNIETEKQNGKLEKVIMVDSEHHRELIAALGVNCKLTPDRGPRTPIPQ